MFVRKIQRNISQRFFLESATISCEPAKLMTQHLHDVHHSILEEDKVHYSASHNLIVLAHEHLKSHIQSLIVRQLQANISIQASTDNTGV